MGYKRFGTSKNRIEIKEEKEISDDDFNFGLMGSPIFITKLITYTYNVFEYSFVKGKIKCERTVLSKHEIISLITTRATQIYNGDDKKVNHISRESDTKVALREYNAGKFVDLLDMTSGAMTYVGLITTSPCVNS